MRTSSNSTRLAPTCGSCTRASARAEASTSYPAFLIQHSPLPWPLLELSRPPRTPPSNSVKEVELCH